jgi:hypothetical protein
MRSSFEETLTPEEIETTTRLRAALAAAKYPKTFRVPMRDIEVIEAYLEKMRDANRAEWKAAGSPDEWHKPMSIYCGPNFGPMFKGVELLPDEPAGHEA